MDVIRVTSTPLLAGTDSQGPPDLPGGPWMPVTSSSRLPIGTQGPTSNVPKSGRRAEWGDTSDMVEGIERG